VDGPAEAVARWAAEQQADVLAALEAVADPRIAGAEGLAAAELDAALALHFPEADAEAVRQELVAAGLARETGGRVAAAEGAEAARAALDRELAARPLPWAAGLTQGGLLAAFAAYCRDEPAEVEVLAAEEARLRLRRRREEAVFELRAGLVLCERLAGEAALLACDLRSVPDAWVRAFAASPAARGSLCLVDLARLEKMCAARSPLPAYLDWFLRDAHGVKLAAGGTFTQTLLELGVITLGFG